MRKGEEQIVRKGEEISRGKYENEKNRTGQKKKTRQGEKERRRGGKRNYDLHIIHTWLMLVVPSLQRRTLKIRGASLSGVKFALNVELKPVEIYSRKNEFDS
jgi:hypothetical protein